VSNHQSLADIPLITHLDLDSKWLAKAELFDFPIFGWMMRMAGDIPVARGDRRKAAQALLQCARYLRQRCSVVFFPEGTRSRTGEVLAFNDGPFQLAVREKIPVLPLAIEGSGAALPRNTWLFGGTQDIYLTVLEPVDPGDRDAQQLREFVRQAIADEVSRLARKATVLA
jgi:1-acyl-sn-glycerol-3-phosphate acyltransferase